MKINREMIRKLRIIVPKTLLILVVLGGFLWFNQKPSFSKYHSYVVETFDGERVSLSGEQFQRIIEAYGDDINYMPDWAFEHGTPREGRRIELYKTKDMSGKCDVMYTGVIFFEDRDDRALVICREKFNGGYSMRAWKYESQQTIRKVLAAVDEAIDEAEGE